MVLPQEGLTVDADQGLDSQGGDVVVTGEQAVIPGVALGGIGMAIEIDVLHGFNGFYY